MDSVEQLTKELRLKGGAQRAIEDDAEAAEWRKRARAAARALGRPVETARCGRVTVAALRDWPANELEAEVHQAKLRNAMDRMASSFKSDA
ncbi:hypothetical protein PTQ19_10260 [Microbacterium esteraromaticum]|uniref:hypothetical protein n=1 Tax=Microbacterium esteraromaticum TaxID=57043 RepID=UPI002367CFC8|nr:hypothetical protein [Microbacterium esteraromaticum]WDH77904.1 hypothetical protein PTQ19_10260 [Microbacterium esteraromaticum]